MGQFNEHLRKARAAMLKLCDDYLPQDLSDEVFTSQMSVSDMIDEVSSQAQARFESTIIPVSYILIRNVAIYLFIPK